jgi:Flp pilus assembly protein TadG
MLARLAAFRKLKTDSRGAAAVEFALVAGPLIFMICACIELAMIILLSVTLDNATDIASRKIRTGTISASTTPDGFKDLVCANMGWMKGSCKASMRVDVRVYDSFAAVTTAPPPIVDGKWNIGETCKIGTGSQIQMARIYYTWPMFTPVLQGAFTSLSNKDIVITSTAVFRNEPF